MVCRLFNGKLVASTLLDRVRHHINITGVSPRLACILVGNNPASHVYVGHKQRACKEVGIASELIRLPEDVSNHTVENCLEDLSSREDVDGILVQMPLPHHLDERQICNLVPFEKDIDGLSSGSIGSLVYGQARFIPPTVQAVCHALVSEGIETKGKQVLIAGRSRHVGLPLALLLQGYRTNPDLPEIGEATILLAHRHTSGHNLRDMASRADIIISATGVVGLIQPDMIKEGAVLMDVGITRKITPGGKIRLMGDIDPKCKEFASLMTPVPGGIGPLTISHLCRNTLNSNLLRNGFPILSLLETYPDDHI